MTSGGTPYLVFGSNKLTCVALPILRFARLFRYSLADLRRNVRGSGSSGKVWTNTKEDQAMYLLTLF
jgi:hypothetical protein